VQALGHQKIGLGQCQLRIRHGKADAPGRSGAVGVEFTVPVSVS